MNVMVTGGAGYIGSHAVKQLLEAGHTVVASTTSSAATVRPSDSAPSLKDGSRLSKPTRAIGATIEAALREHKCRHRHALRRARLRRRERDRAAALLPGQHAASALSLIEACDAVGVTRFIFSSTCATYGEPPRVPMDEQTPQSPGEPLRRFSKLHVEHILRDYAEACRRNGKAFGYAALRYFNVAGSDPDGLVGEDHEPETHLIPVVIEAAMGVRDSITIFGTDYDTPDGTCIRDYVHVCDLSLRPTSR
jgi:UDP-glucose 4-epimerase